MMVVPILLHHVLSIIFRRTQEQVRRIATHWIVATMADEEPVWDQAILRSPSKAGRNETKRFTFELDAEFSGIIMMSTSLLLCALPFPAIIWAPYIYFTPEPLGVV